MFDKPALSGAIVCFQFGFSGFPPRATIAGPIWGEPTFKDSIRLLRDLDATRRQNTEMPTQFANLFNSWLVPILSRNLSGSI